VVDEPEGSLVIRSPTFCLIGAPRTGTTTMYRALADHPRIYMTSTKEPFYFCDDLEGMSQARDETAYGRLFDGVTPGHLASGEASVWYLYSRSAPVRLRDYNPDVKLLVHVRNPLEVVESLHAMNYFVGWEDEPDLETAVGLEEARMRGERLPRFSPNPLVLQYTRAARLGEQLTHWQSIFPPSHFLITVFDDLVKDTTDVYRSTLRFLDVPDDGRTSFPRANVRRSPRSGFVRRLLRTPPPGLHAVGYAVRRALRAAGVNDRWLLRRLSNLNSGREGRRASNPAVRAHLRQVLSDDVIRLSEMLDRDLSHWLLEEDET